MISIIIPALNEERVIGKCLDALTRITYRRDKIEVIVVDNGSCDSTIAIARSYTDVLPIIVVEQTDMHISAMRNAGARLANGSVLAFLDADCLAPEQWLEPVSGLLRDESAGVVGAYYTIPEQSSWVGKAWCGGEQVEKTGAVGFIPAGTMFVSTATFKRLGGFDETIQTNEDYEFCQRVLGAGLSVRAYAELSTIHLGTPQTLSGFYKKQKWHGKNVMTVFLRDVRRMRNMKAVAFAIFTLLCLMGMAAGVLWAMLSYDFRLLGAAAAAFITAPLLLALQVTVKKKRPELLPSLLVLYGVYGIARAFCIVHSDTKRSKDAREGGR
jgi:glycosyltransferase involved in cell wall biosynthesis